MKIKNVIISTLIFTLIILYISSFVSAATCGNGQCEFGETIFSCPRDCTTTNYCGDGSCNNGETCNSCVTDCGTCPPPQECTSHAYTACSGSGDNTDRYYYNSCNQREELAQDCGDSSYTGINFCSNNDVFRIYNHKGCANNACYSNNQQIIQQDCGESGYTGNNFCSNNDLYRTYETKGCANRACFSTPSNILQQDCGESGYTGATTCQNNNLYKIFETKGCLNNACFSTPSNIFEQDCGEDTYSNNFCSNDDVYRTFMDRGCNINACFTNYENQFVQDCGEDTYASDSDGGFFIFTYGQCSAGTDKGCSAGTCFSTTGTNPGSDTCIDTSLLNEFQTSGSFNCIFSLVNCDDQDLTNIDQQENTCEWTDYNCGTGACQVLDQANISCEDYNTPNTNYAVTQDSCTLGCIGSDCCEPEVLNFCGDGNLGGNEECDSGVNNGLPCTPSYGETCNFCTVSCTIDSETGPFCGDNILQSQYEECEGTDLNGETCNSLGFFSGTLSCTSICDLNTSNCNVCIEDWQPETNSCQNDDTQLISYIDANSCGTTINLPANNGTYTTCDFCTPNEANTTWTDWENTFCSGDQMQQTRSITTYDGNNCFAITQLPSDMFDNITITETQLVGHDYVNGTWNDWSNITTCQQDNTYIQERSMTQTDSYGCAQDLIIYENQTLLCDFCMPNMVFTDWTVFSDFQCFGNQMNQTRSRTFFDQNFCGEILNTTETESQLVGPDYVNGTWSDWANIGSCVLDSQYQESYMTQTDSYGCAQDITLTQNQTIPCDTCTPNWTLNQTWGICLDYTQSRNYYDSNMCYAQTGLPSDLIGQPANETQSCIDEELPVIIIINPENQNYNYTQIPVEISCTDNTAVDSIWYVIDATNYAYTIPTIFNAEENTTYILNAYCNDTYNNVATASVIFSTNMTAGNGTPVQDLDIPVVTIINPENQNYNYTQIPVEITCTDAFLDSIWFDVNGGAVQLYSVPTTFVAEEDMTYVLTAYCNDSANHLVTDSIIFSTNMTAGNGTPVQDLDIPVVTIINPENQNYNYTQIPVEITCTEAFLDSVWYVVDGQTLSYTVPTIFNAQENQTYVLTAYCNDSVNHVSTDSVIFSTNMTAGNGTPVQDLDTPIVTIINPVNQNYNYTTIPVEITCTDAFLDSIWYNVNGDANQVYSGPATFNAEENQTYQINAYCNDSANRLATDSVVFSTNMTAGNQTPVQDLDMPVLEIILPENNTNYNTTDVPLNISCTDIFSVDSIWFFVNNQARQSYTDSLLYVPGVSENHRFRLNAFCNDSANHVATEGITFDIFPDSNVTNTTLDDNTTIDNSNITNSNITNSTINNTEIIGVGCTIINSTLNNVKINMTGYCYIKNEYHENETVFGYAYYSSIGDPINNTITAIIFESINSTYNFNIIYGDNNTYFTTSTVNDSIIGNTNIIYSKVLFADLYNCTVIESSISHVYGRNCLIRGSNISDNSTIIDSNITNSNITNSTVTNSTVEDSNITNSTVNNSIITNSTLIDFVINDANITNNWICNGTISQEGFTYNASLEGCADIRTLFDYVKNATIQSPTEGASYIIGTNIIFSADITNMNRWNATKNYTSMWDFGDGTNTNTTNTSHTYSGNPRTITATLTINDGKNTASFTATFSLTANCTDGFQNQDETSTDTGGVCAPPRSGGGGGSGTPFRMNYVDFTNSCTQDIRMSNGDKVRITFQGTNYQYTQTELTNQAVLYGEGQELTINQGSQKSYDLNNDGKNDITISLTKIENLLGSYTLGIIDCKLTGILNITNTLPIMNETTTGAIANETANITGAMTNQTTNQTGTPITGYLLRPIEFLKHNWLWILIVLLLILLILAALYLLLFKKKGKKTKKGRKK